jgi:hypothetical protein
MKTTSAMTGTAKATTTKVTTSNNMASSLKSDTEQDLCQAVNAS